MPSGITSKNGVLGKGGVLSRVGVPSRGVGDQVRKRYQVNVGYNMQSD